MSSLAQVLLALPLAMVPPLARDIAVVCALTLVLFEGRGPARRLARASHRFAIGAATGLNRAFMPRASRRAVMAGATTPGQRLAASAAAPPVVPARAPQRGRRVAMAAFVGVAVVATILLARHAADRRVTKPHILALLS